MDEALFMPSIAKRGKMLYHNGENPEWVTPVIPPGTVTRVDLSAPIEFTVTSNPIQSSGTLGFVSKKHEPGLFYATPPAAHGPMHLRPLTNSDLPIVDPEHGGTGSTEPVGDGGIIISKDGKMTNGPVGIGFIHQGIDGVLPKRIDLEKDTFGKVSRAQIGDGIAVPDCTGQMARMLSNDGIKPVWVARPHHSVEKYFPEQLSENNARGYSLSLPSMNPGDCLQFTFVYLVLQSEPESERYTRTIRIGKNEKKTEGIWMPSAGVESVSISIRLYRAADKIVVIGENFSELWTLDYSKENIFEFFLGFDRDAPGIGFTPLLAKTILY